MSTFIPKQVHLLQHWITERERIREQHDARPQPPRPWTRDAVLDKYSFCNVVRMDDRVSKWLFKNWYVHAAPAHMLLVQATLARLINEPRTLATFDPPVISWDKANEEWLMGHLHRLMGQGLPVFTSAYLVIGTEFGRAGGKCAAIPRIVTRVAEQHVRIITDYGHSMRAMHTALMGIKGLGSFLAGQIVADMRHLRPARYSPDRMVWAPKGPGSIRGMSRLVNGTPRGFRIGSEAFQDRLEDLRKLLTLPKRAEAMDLQNCLCEFDKYSRAVTDGHRPRRLYRRGNGKA